MDRLLLPLLESVHFRTARPKAVLLVGPRGSGKTTLAKQLQERRGSPGLYASWDDPEFRRQATASPYGFIDSFQPLFFKKVLAVIDEIDKLPRWIHYIKELRKTHGDAADVIAVSSNDIAISGPASAGLQACCRRYRLHPLCLSEILRVGFSQEKDTPQHVLENITKNPPNPGRRSQEAFAALLRFGGFPEPFQSQSERRHGLWLRQRQTGLVREDLRDFSRIQMLSSVEQLITLLQARVGAPLSFNGLRRQLGVNIASARLWVRRLERLHYCFPVTPFPGALERCLRHAPKFYLYDWSESTDAERRFENLVACALKRWCDFCEDWGQPRLNMHYVRDKEKREAQFLLTIAGRPRLLIGTIVERAAPRRALRYFSQRLGQVPAVLVCAKPIPPGADDKVQVLPAASFLAAIP